MTRITSFSGSGFFGPKNAGAPALISAPVITGTKQVGSTITTTKGIWTNSPTSYTYQWWSNSSPISGATSQSYVIQASDYRRTLFCVITASNLFGTRTVNSNFIAGITYVTAPAQWIVTTGGYPTTSSLSFVLNDGVLSQNEQFNYSAFATNSYHLGAAVSPNNDFVYFPNGTKNYINIIPINPNTGIYTGSGATTASITSGGSFPIRMTISPDGKNAYVGYNNAGIMGVFTRNTTTGALTAVSNIDVGSTVSVLSSDGAYLYTPYSGGMATYSRNSSNGALTLAGTENSTSINSGFLNSSSIRISGDNGSVLVTDFSSGNLYNYVRDLTTGLLSLTQTISLPNSYYGNGIDISNDGSYVYVALYDINQTVGPTVALYTRSLTAPHTLTFVDTYQSGSSPGEQSNGFTLSKNEDLIIWAGSGGNLLNWTRNKTNGTLSINSSVTGQSGSVVINN